MNIKILALLSLFYCSASLAQDTVVYRWVDSNNVVHYSHEHPNNVDFAEVKVQVAYSPPPTKKSADTVEEATKDDKADLSQMSEESIKKNCEAAKMNLDILDAFENVMIQNEKGEEQALTAEEKEKQLELSKKYVGIYCADEK